MGRRRWGGREVERTAAAAPSGHHASCHLGAAGLPGSGERRAEADKLLEDVRLGEAAAVRAGAYSGGMKRRLSVAIALLGDPQVGHSPVELAVAQV